MPLLDPNAADRHIAYGNFDADFVDELAASCVGQHVLEVFAGNGLLASRLAAKGVSIRATSLFAGHDGHASGFYHPVEELSADKAVIAYRDQSDILLMSWPTATEGATAAALAWGPDKPIIFIGEVTDFTQGTRALGGCASDLFFALTEEGRQFASYRPNNMLDRATLRRLDPAKVELWRRGELKLPDYDPVLPTL